MTLKHLQDNDVRGVVKDSVDQKLSVLMNLAQIYLEDRQSDGVLETGFNMLQIFDKHFETYVGDPIVRTYM